MKKKVVLCIPTITRPFDPCLDAVAASAPVAEAAGWQVDSVYEVGNVYISSARATMLRKALDTKPDAVVFWDHDVSCEPPDLLKLLETEGDVVAGTYRFKEDAETYMGTLLTDAAGRPQVRADGCIRGERVPAGFLKVTVQAVAKFMEAYPLLCFGPRFNPSVDLFNHGAHKGLWWGEDYAFSRNWRDAGGEIWIVPNLDLTHWDKDKPYPGNFHEYMLRRPGGSKDPARLAPTTDDTAATPAIPPDPQPKESLNGADHISA